MKIIKIPYSEGTDVNKGTEKAPDEIVKQLNECWSNENFQDNKYEVIDSNLKELHDGEIYIGGDHSISYYVFKKFFKNNAGILIFDAHPDAVQDFETHEDLLPGIINNKLLKKENIVLVGIRNWHATELKFLQENRIKYYKMDEITAEGIHEIADAVMSVAKNWGAVYLSIDIDAVDPAYAPGTGYCEPGGMTSRELLYLIHRLKKLNKIKGADLVEINPKRDINNLTVKLGAKILVELC